MLNGRQAESHGQSGQTSPPTLNRRDFMRLGIAALSGIALGTMGCEPVGPKQAKLDSLDGVSQEYLGGHMYFIEVDVKFWKPELIKSQQRLDERKPKNANWVITLERVSKVEGNSQQSPQLVEAKLTRPRQDTLLFMFVDKEMKKPVNNARAESRFK